MAKTTKTREEVPPAPVDGGYDWSQEQTTGFENVTAQDLGIPFLAILQALSPEVNRSDKDYNIKKIAGAQPGTIINTVSRQIYYQPEQNELLLIPCGYDRKWVEWRARNSGGGFVKAHQTDQILDQTTKDEKTGQDLLPNGNMIRATCYFFVLVVELDGKGLDEPIKAVIGMSSTQLRNARTWLNLMSGIKFTQGNRQFTPPMFSHYYSVGTRGENNDKGSWMGWKIEISGPVNDKKLIDNARETAQKVVADARRLLAAPPAPAKEDEVPFA